MVNDLDPAVHAFWHSIVHENDALVRLIQTTPVTVPEWQRQRDIYREGQDSDPLRLGFAFFYLNRTNRSGVLRGGVIGGLQQNGSYKIDARFNRATLIERVRAIGGLADRITVYNTDGRAVIMKYADDPETLMYIDPPYVKAGSQLYLNAFEHRDHIALAKVVTTITRTHWLMTYDISELIEKLYSEHFQRRYELNYSARHPGKTDELMIASPSVATQLKRLTRLVTDAGAGT